ncbi:MAG TPA: hypothetical protein VMW56_30375, partial [Candidatus Margulisiibacteriota bacterium]|nr:hypothetical protein [Candidatus Margulisiibacteriota bacterium]
MHKRGKVAAVLILTLTLTAIGSRADVGPTPTPGVLALPDSTTLIPRSFARAETRADASISVLSVGTTGCADGQREGFVDESAYPDIAGCGGGWSIPGIHTVNPGAAPACGIPTYD